MWFFLTLFIILEEVKANCICSLDEACTLMNPTCCDNRGCYENDFWIKYECGQSHCRKDITGGALSIIIVITAVLVGFIFCCIYFLCWKNRTPESTAFSSLEDSHSIPMAPTHII